MPNSISTFPHLSRETVTPTQLHGHFSGNLVQPHEAETDGNRTRDLLTVSLTP